MLSRVGTFSAALPRLRDRIEPWLKWGPIVCDSDYLILERLRKNLLHLSIETNHSETETVIMSRLFKSVMMGSIDLDHRIAMAPLTRYRMDDDWKATPMSKGV